MMLTVIKNKHFFYLIIWVKNLQTTYLFVLTIKFNVTKIGSRTSINIRNSNINQTIEI